jgi:hypothetical protein
VSLVTPTLVIEVGVWKGRSTCFLAEALKQRTRSGAVVAVDTWLGALEFWTRTESAGAPDPTRNLLPAHGYPQVYYQFLTNVAQRNLSEYVIPFPASSRLAHDFFALHPAQPRAQLIHIDAAHEYRDVVEDVRMWWGLLDEGGIMLGDDFSSAWPGVIRAACEHAESYGLSLETWDVKWWVRKQHGRARLGHAWLEQCKERACAKARGEKWRDRCNEAVAHAQEDHLRTGYGAGSTGTAPAPVAAHHGHSHSKAAPKPATHHAAHHHHHHH